MAVTALTDAVAMNKAVAKTLQIVKKGKYLHMSDHVKCWSKTSIGWFPYDRDCCARLLVESTTQLPATATPFVGARILCP